MDESTDLLVSRAAAEVLGIREEAAVVVEASTPRGLEVAPVAELAEKTWDEETVTLNPEDADVRAWEFAVLANAAGVRPISGAFRVQRDSSVRRGHIRMSYIQRRLFEVARGEKLWLFVPTEKGYLHNRRRIITGWRLLHSVLRFSRFLARKANQWVFGIPSMIFRTAGAPPGEQGQVVSISSRAMLLMGASEADHVVVEWGPKRAIAYCLPLPDVPFIRSAETTAISNPGGLVERPVPGRIALLPSSIRKSLGIHGEQVVVIRRRVTSQVSGRLGELALPLAGVVFAALALPDLDIGVRIVAGTVAVLVVISVGLAKLRLRRPPGRRKMD